MVASIALHGQTPISVADRVAIQNAIFEDQYQSDLRYSPERATAFGDYRYNDKLAEHSLAALAARDKTNREFLSKISAIPTTGMSEQDQLSHDLLARLLELRNTNYDLKEFEMPVDQMNGVHTDLADLPLAVPLDSVKHYEDYLARLRQIPRVLDQTTEVLRAGMKDQLMPVRFLLEKVPVQCQGIIDANPFLLPTKKYPADISAEDQKRLTQEITDAINTDVLPAYRKFADFVRTDYAPQGRTTLAVTSLPDGEKRYRNDIYGRTTTHMTADEIHQIGLREIDRIQAEMTVIAKKQGFADLAAFRASLKNNPKYIPTSAEQILDDYRRYIAQMQPKLPQLFTLLPKSPVTVEAIPAFNLPTPRTIRPVRRMASGPAAWSWLLRISRIAPRFSTKPRRTTKAFPAITCSFRWPNNLPVCRNSARTAWASTRMSRAGRSTPNNSARKWGSTRIRFLITAGFRRNCFARCGWWSTPEFIPRIGRASRWWIFSASPARSMSR